jgi:outer membrane protein
MAQQEQSVGNASEARRTAWGQFLPSLSASSSGSLRSQNRFDPATDRVVTGSSDSYSAGLSASYTSSPEGGASRTTTPRVRTCVPPRPAVTSSASS